MGAGWAWFPAIIASFLVSVYYLKRVLESPFSGMLPKFLAIGLASLIGMTSAYMIIENMTGRAGLLTAATVSGQWPWIATALAVLIVKAAWEARSLCDHSDAIAARTARLLSGPLFAVIARSAQSRPHPLEAPARGV